MTTNTMTDTTTTSTWTQDAYKVSMYQGLIGWVVETQILGDVYYEVYQTWGDAAEAMAAEIATFSDTWRTGECSLLDAASAVDVDYPEFDIQ